MDKKRIFCLVILSLLAVSLVASMASAFWTNEEIKASIERWEQGTLDETIAKYLFLVLITLVIFSALNHVNVIKQKGIQVVLSIVIGFLSVTYLAPKTIWAMTSSYSALGLVLGTLLPFIVLLFFTFTATAEGSANARATQIVLQYVLWIAFVFYMIYTTAIMFGQSGLPFITDIFHLQEVRANWILFINLLITVIGALIVILNSTIRRILGNTLEQAEEEAARQRARRRALGGRMLEQAARN